MAFRCWKIGLHIQKDKIVAVALQRTRSGWSLARWWQIPLPTDLAFLPAAQAQDALIATLLPWRRELPWQHTASVAFPAGRTLQKTLPRAALTMRDSEQAQWVASAMAQQVEMTPDALCFDYQLNEQTDGWSVTAAQRKDVERLQRMARALRLHTTAITPDASALRHFLPWLANASAGLAWRDAAQWLWASASGWGCLPLAEAPSLTLLEERLAAGALMECTSHSIGDTGFDPWSVIGQKYPPLPGNGDAFAVAIALALGAQR